MGLTRRAHASKAKPDKSRHCTATHAVSERGFVRADGALCFLCLYR